MLSISILLDFWVCLTLLALAETNKITAKNDTSRIVGGQDAVFGQFPYQGFLQATTTSGSTLSCGCSLIASTWAVTAAHCTSSGISTADAAFGLVSLSQYSELAVSIRQIFNHPYYDSTTYSNDISLLWLSSIPPIGSTITLPPANEIVANGTSCTISGFGLTSETGSTLSETLQWATVPIESHSSCMVDYSTISLSAHLCAGTEAGGVDTCQGDSGGPLTCSSSSGPVLQGITSFGRGCARPGIPGVYTRVSSYNSWIEQTILANSGSYLKSHSIFYSLLVSLLLATFFIDI